MEVSESTLPLELRFGGRLRCESAPGVEFGGRIAQRRKYQRAACFSFKLSEQGEQGLLEGPGDPQIFSQQQQRLVGPPLPPIE